MVVLDYPPQGDDPPEDQAAGSARTRFKKGQSGNPKGRPRGSKNVATYLAEMLDETVTFREGGRRRRATKSELIALSIVNGAIKGSPKHIAALLKLTGQDRPESDEERLTGVLVVPVRPESNEEWERIHGLGAGANPEYTHLRTRMAQIEIEHEQECRAREKREAEGRAHLPPELPN